MNAEIPSIGRAVGMAWGDAGRVFSELAVPTTVAAAVIAGASFIQDVLALEPMSPQAGLSNVVLGLLLGALQTFLVTPYFIAIHRLIILGERASGYPLKPGDQRFQRYFGWSILFAVVAFFAIFIGVLLPLIVTMSPLGRFVLIAIAMAAIIYLVLRLVLFLPSIAVDAPGATLGNAWQDTSGRALRILGILLLVLLPLLVLLIILSIVAALMGLITEGEASLLSKLWLAVFTGAIGVIFGAFVAVVVSRLYAAHADRLKRPA